MIVAGLQIDIVWGDPEANFVAARRLAQSAVDAGARLVVLPEMFATGFSMAAREVAAHAPSITGFLSELARTLDVAVIGGFADPNEPRPRNAAALFGRDGEELLRYHKVHPFSLAGEHQHYDGGTQLLTATVDDLRITPVICYDLRFPEIFRAAALDTDLFVVIANWPRKRRSAWSALLRARAIENQAWVLGVNRVGTGDGLEYTGDSVLIDPSGEAHSVAACAATAFSGAVEAAEVTRAREHFSFLSDRRRDLYGSLERDA